MKPRKTRPNQLHQQRQEARREIQATGIKPPGSTFPRQMTPSDHALRRLQKRRINPQALLSMVKSTDPVLRGSAIERIKTDKKTLKRLSLTELKNLTEHPNPIVRKAAENALEQIKTRMAMLGTRRPFAATAHLLEILERTETLKAVSSQLKREFGEEFTGIVVFGSLAKGYARPESDIDYGVIASTPKPVKRFRELAREKGLPLCDEHYVNSGEKSSKTTAMLFNGLFFGDRKALKKSQRAAFIRIESPQEWNRVRRQIFKNETHLETAFKRLGITSKREQQRLKAAAALRVPPPYNEMKKLLGIK